MTLREIQTILDAELLCGAQRLDDQVSRAFGSDLMSDALAYADQDTLLLTGLCNPQVVRTAEMLDITHIVFVRGKRPNEETLELAREGGLAVLATGQTMFNACGRLYAAGLEGGGQHG
jgi:predicted transcriptional regulator